MFYLICPPVLTKLKYLRGYQLKKCCSAAHLGCVLLFISVIPCLLARWKENVGCCQPSKVRSFRPCLDMDDALGEFRVEAVGAVILCLPTQWAVCVRVCMFEVDDPCAVWSTVMNEIVRRGVRLLQHLTSVPSCENWAFCLRPPEALSLTSTSLFIPFILCHIRERTSFEHFPYISWADGEKHIFLQYSPSYTFTHFPCTFLKADK